MIDFYYWKGIPCARKWPDRSPKKPSAGQKASMAAFSEANASLKLLSTHLREYWASLSVGKSYFWPDEFRGKFMKYWQKYRTYPNIILDFKDEGSSSPRKICFKIRDPGHIRMCVYKGVTGLVAKMIPEAGYRWPAYFGIRPKPIWCGWTTTSEELHAGPFSVSADTPMYRYVADMQVDPAAACANAWAKLVDEPWDSGYGNYVGALVEGRQVAGPAYRYTIWDRSLMINGQIEQWWSAFPGVQPARCVYHPVIREWGEGVGSMWLPEFWVFVEMDAHIIDIPFDVSDFDFPETNWKFLAKSFEPHHGYCCDLFPAGCYIGAQMGWYEYGTIDFYAGEAGWECIDIPDWIFESPGKYWLAMVDEDDMMLPGPYLPL